MNKNKANKANKSNDELAELLNNIIEKNKTLNENECKENIKNLILTYFKKRRGPKKAFKFYKVIIELYETYPLTILDLIDSIKKWGYWKDYFIILLMNKNKDLELYIYDLIIKQLEKDIDNFRNKKRISTLVKWIPKEGKSFDKKLNFIKNICQRIFPNDQPFTARRKYRKMISKMNKSLGTAEIFACSKNYDDIDFKKIPTLALKKNKNTFLKDEMAKSKLNKFLFKKYIKMNYRKFLNQVIYRKIDEFDRGILKDVWTMNRLDYYDQIKDIIGIDLKKTNVMLDMSKSMYDKKYNIISIGIALLANSFKNNVAINCHDPYLIKFSTNRFAFYENIDKITSETVYHDKININKLVEKNILKKRRKLLIITDKDIGCIDDCIDDCTDNGIDKVGNKVKIIYWKLTDNNKIETINKNDKDNDDFIIKTGNLYYHKNNTNRKIKTISKIIDKSNELDNGKYYYYHDVYEYISSNYTDCLQCVMYCIFFTIIANIIVIYSV